MTKVLSHGTTDTVHELTHHFNKPIKSFRMTVDGVDVTLCISRKSQCDFEEQGLFAMDDCMDKFSDRLTPANAPHLRPNPLELLGQMLSDGLSEDNSHKVMICLLWLGHHYPSINGFNKTGNQFSFAWDNEKNATSHFMAHGIDQPCPH